MSSLPQQIIDILAELPNTPGVYEMQNADHETLYVGKAKNLKSRVKSYFLASANHSRRIAKLIEKVENIEWTQTGSELEALILESNLIKQKNPKFNILLRDDKNFSYFKISMNDDFPRITLARKIIKDGSRYFGPKTSSSSVRKTIDLLQSLFHFRSTPLEIDEIKPGTVEIKNSGNQKYPCLNYHLKKCDAPCIGKISKAEYAKRIDQAIDFLKGNTKEIEKKIQEEMMELVAEQKFELAAKKRDSLLSIQSIAEKQIISAPNDFSADIIGIFSDFGHVFFHLLSAREGKVINSQTISVDLKTREIDTEMIIESMKQFLRSHPERTTTAPKNIIINPEYFDENERDEWEDFFEYHFSIKTKLHFPQKGKQKKLLEMAEENAKAYAKRHVASFLKNNEEKEKTLQKLQKALGMKKLPSRMECYDISHFSGEKTVASMVVFEDGEQKNKDYRSFNIKSLEPRGIDDFASLQEALKRRLARLPKKYPEDWSFEKVTRKSDFKEISKLLSVIPNSRSVIPNSQSVILKPQPVILNLIQDPENSLSSSIKIKDQEIDKKSICEFYSVFSIFYKKDKKTKEMSEILFCITRYTEKKNVRIDVLENKGTPEEIMFAFSSLLKKFSNVFLEIQIDIPEINEFLEHKGFTLLNGSWKKEWKYKADSFESIPDLIIIDGGKGQLSSVAKVFLENEYAEDITLCSLAKREEEVFLLDKKSVGAHPCGRPIENEEINMILTNIQKNSSEGKILQEIRDEAHRFAITKNRVGREKNAQKSVLDEIKGIGAKTKKLLKQKFGGVSGIRSASDEELLEVVNEKILKSLREKV